MRQQGQSVMFIGILEGYIIKFFPLLVLIGEKEKCLSRICLFHRRSWRDSTNFHSGFSLAS